MRQRSLSIVDCSIFLKNLIDAYIPKVPFVGQLDASNVFNSFTGQKAVTQKQYCQTQYFAIKNRLCTYSWSNPASECIVESFNSSKKLHRIQPKIKFLRLLKFFEIYRQSFLCFFICAEYKSSFLEFK